MHSLPMKIKVPRKKPETVSLKALPTLFKDLANVVRARNIFFVPFFAALTGFLFTQKAYVVDASFVIKILVLATLAICIFYAYVVTQFLFHLETLAMFFGLNQNSEGHFFKTLEDEPPSLNSKNTLDGFSAEYEFESKVYKWTMWSLYICAGSVLFDLYFGTYLESKLTQLLLNWIS